MAGHVVVLGSFPVGSRRPARQAEHPSLQEVMRDQLADADAPAGCEARAGLPGPWGMGELGRMEKLPSAVRRTAILLAVVPVLLATVAVHAAAEMVLVEPLAAQARRAGLRVLTGSHLVLATDRPVRNGDGVEELPAVFDQAFAAWCDHYGLDPADHPNWQCFGCLVVDRERFRSAGLLPDVVPKFANGFCDNNRFWLIDQPNPAYRRHLLLHEGAHAFTLTLRRLATPVWYNEGIAEFLATHRLEDSGDGGQRTFRHTPMPDRPEDVEQLGRIEEIQSLQASGQPPALDDVLALSVEEHGTIADYATSWAAVAMFAGHPRYAADFEALQRGPLRRDFNRRLAGMASWDADLAGRDFDAFTADLAYGWDFNRMAVDWSAGQPLAGPRSITVDASRGWQNSGFAVAVGRRYTVTAAGRIGVGEVTDETDGTAIPLESEPDGITLQWYRGRPVGRLLAGQWVTPANGGRPRFEVVAEGRQAELAPLVDGPLYFKVNQAPGRLADDRGRYSVELKPRGPVAAGRQ
jgi:hypothetical protein